MTNAFTQPETTSFDFSEECLSALASWSEQVKQVTLATGEKVWLVKGYEEVRLILSDARFGAGDEPMHRASWSEEERKIGRLLHNDPPQHGWYRQPLNKAFSARRIQRLEPRIREIAREQLDVLSRSQNRSADLIETFALPVPERVIHEILGILPVFRSEFREIIEGLLRRGQTSEESRVFVDQALDCMCRVIEEIRRAPTGGLLDELIATGQFADVVLADLAVTLLMGGYLTITGMVTESVAVLSQNPEARRNLLVGAPQSSETVEELLRYITVIQYGVDRVAREHIRLGGQEIKEGDRVVAFLPAANRDPALCPHPEAMDATRRRVRHASFGFGPHQCLGQQLARVELEVMLTELFGRFPHLRPARACEALPRRIETVIGGFDRFPVTW